MLHAPRQTGKASALTALRDLFNSRVIGDFCCVDVNVEVGQVACVDVQEGMRAILSRLAMSAEFWATTMWRTGGRTLWPSPARTKHGVTLSPASRRSVLEVVMFCYTSD